MDHNFLKAALIVLASAVGIWLSVVISLFILTIGSLQQAADYARDKNLDGVVGRLEAAEQSLTYFRWSSLFISELPYVRETIALTDEVIALGHQAVQATDYGGTLVQDMLSGKETDIEAWQTIETFIQNLVSHMETVQELSREKRVQQAASVLGSETYSKGLSFLDEAEQTTKTILPLIDQLPDLLGYEQKQRYVLLFQNNMELRPTGGFMGSFGVAEFQDGKLQSFEVEDIYVPDGQIKGYVEEPEPIREYLFGGDHPGWRLRDSNWHPNFPSAAEDIAWFLREGEIDEIDGIIAVNLLPVKDMIKILGPLHIPDYEVSVNSKNLYEKAQYYAENDFFPGSTQKKDFLGAVGNQLLLQAEEGNTVDTGALLPLLLQNMREKQVMFWFDDSEMQQVFSELSWTGELSFSPSDDPTTLDDYLHINEANLGINKTNCCVDRAVTLGVGIRDNLLERSLSIQYVNNNPTTPNPPLQWGGGYKNYLRVFVPKDARLERILIDGVEVDPSNIQIEFFGNLTSFGTLVLVKGESSAEVVIEYVEDIEPSDLHMYRLSFQKQSGIEFVPFSIVSSEDSEYGFQSAKPSGAALTSENVRKDREFAFELTHEVE